MPVYSLPVLGSLYETHPIIAAILVGIPVLVALVILYLYPYSEYTLSFRNLPGPKPASFFWGNIKQLMAARPGLLHAEWVAQYGSTMRYRLLLGNNRLFSSDPVFLGYVLQHADDFPKPERTSKALARMLGNGLLSAEDVVHRRQRKIINPAFSPQAIRDVTPIFWDKAYELKGKLMGFVERDENLISEMPSPTPPAAGDEDKGGRKIDVMKYLGQMALDIIGLAGFGYDFQALSHTHNELADNFSAMFSASTRITPLAILQNFLPFFSFIPSKNKSIIKKSHAATMRVAQDLVERKKRAIAAEYTGALEKGSDIGKDLLSILIKANMAPDLRPDQKMTDAEVMAQITTFILAGNETSSTALTWILYRLGLNPDVQKRLREEVQSVSSDTPSTEELNALTYLDKVVHESLRLDGPVPGTMRKAKVDAVIPLGTPVVGRDGTLVDSVPVKKGMEIFIRECSF